MPGQRHALEEGDLREFPHEVEQKGEDPQVDLGQIEPSLHLQIDPSQAQRLFVLPILYLIFESRLARTTETDTSGGPASA